MTEFEKDKFSVYMMSGGDGRKSRVLRQMPCPKCGVVQMPEPDKNGTYHCAVPKCNHLWPRFK